MIKPIVTIPTLVAEGITNGRSLKVLRLTTGEFLASLSSPCVSCEGNTPQQAIQHLELELCKDAQDL